MKKSLIALAALASMGDIAVAGRRQRSDEPSGHELRAMDAGGLMAITTSSASADGPNQHFTARHLDDAATPAAAVYYPGFKPKYVKVMNLTDRLTWEWFHGMTQGHYIKHAANGDTTLAADSELSVEVDTGARPSITLAAAVTLQNKQYQIQALA